MGGGSSHSWKQQGCSQTAKSWRVSLISVPQGWQEAPQCPESLLWVVSTVHLLPTSPPPLQSACPSVGLITSSQLPIWTLQWDPGGWCFCRPYLDRWGMERGVFDLYTI